MSFQVDVDRGVHTVAQMGSNGVFENEILVVNMNRAKVTVTFIGTIKSNSLSKSIVLTRSSRSQCEFS